MKKGEVYSAMKRQKSKRKATEGRMSIRKAATEGAMSRDKGLGTCREKSLNSGNVYRENQRLLASIRFHHQSLSPLVAIFTSCLIEDGRL